jgi:hypothetical protein
MLGCQQLMGLVFALWLLLESSLKMSIEDMGGVHWVFLSKKLAWPRAFSGCWQVHSTADDLFCAS